VLPSAAVCMREGGREPTDLCRRPPACACVRERASGSVPPSAAAQMREGGRERAAREGEKRGGENEWGEDKS
jgi:hypothetical protein